MNHLHPNDVVIGTGGIEREVPPLIIEGDELLGGKHNGSVCIHSGTVTIMRGATYNGSVTVQPSAQLSILGVLNGSLTINSDATVEVSGAHNGSTHVGGEGLLRISAGGRAAGSLMVRGRVENLGERGGVVTLIGGEIIDLPGSTVKQPESGADGAQIYRW